MSSRSRRELRRSHDAWSSPALCPTIHSMSSSSRAVDSVVPAT
ncbi:50S ribosomal protein L32 [Streptomyces sp. NPDC002785]